MYLVATTIYRASEQDRQGLDLILLADMDKKAQTSSFQMVTGVMIGMSRDKMESNFRDCC
jgi:hypothetical protein